MPVAAQVAETCALPSWHPGPGVTAKDLILAVIARIGVAGATGHVIEYAGSAIAALSMEGRLTLCNMTIEAGGRAGMIAPDETTFTYLAGRHYAPAGDQWDRAVAHWRNLFTDPGAAFDCELHVDVAEIAPMVTWGTTPGYACAIDHRVPDPMEQSDPDLRAAMSRALDYMGLAADESLEGVAIDRVFIGSCTNGRIEDMRSAAEVARGRHIAPSVEAWVVPGSARSACASRGRRAGPRVQGSRLSVALSRLFNVSRNQRRYRRTRPALRVYIQS